MPFAPSAVPLMTLPDDLLITDVGLRGGISGCQVVEGARATRPGLQVLFITGDAESAVSSQDHLSGGMNVMTKPFHLGDLMTRVQALIRQGSSPAADHGPPFRG